MRATWGADLQQGNLVKRKGGSSRHAARSLSEIFGRAGASCKVPQRRAGAGWVGPTRGLQVFPLLSLPQVSGRIGPNPMDPSTSGPKHVRGFEGSSRTCRITPEPGAESPQLRGWMSRGGEDSWDVAKPKFSGEFHGTERFY